MFLDIVIKNIWLKKSHILHQMMEVVVINNFKNLYNFFIYI
jgi:hypothetical protein